MRCECNLPPGDGCWHADFFTCDIQQSLPASPCFLLAINRSHSLAAVRLAATILGIRSESKVCRQRFAMLSSACVKIIHRAPVTTLRPSSKFALDQATLRSSAMWRAHNILQERWLPPPGIWFDRTPLSVLEKLLRPQHKLTHAEVSFRPTSEQSIKPK